MKIIYIFLRRHYYKHDDEQFGISFFRNKGHDVEVWSTVNWTYGRRISTPCNLHDGDLIYINNLSDLNKKLDEISRKDVHFIIYAYHTYQRSDYNLRYTLHKRGFVFSNLTEASDLCEIKLHKVDGIYYFVKGCYELFFTICTVFLLLLPFRLDTIKGKILNKITRFWGPLLVKSKYNFISSKNAYNYIPNAFEYFSKRNVIIPHFDFSNYLRVCDDISKKDIAVFVDEYEIGHSDWEKAGVCPPIENKEKYFSELKTFFDYIENEFNVEVVIAAHPKAEYCGSEFGERKIEYYKTAQLIGESKLVLYMYGTSLTYIFLFKKDFILFNTSQHLKGHMVDGTMIQTRRILNSKVLDLTYINDETPLRHYINHYNSNYDNLVEKYINIKNNEADSYQLIEEYISKL